MLPMKQEIDKPPGQNLSGEGGESSPLSVRRLRHTMGLRSHNPLFCYARENKRH
jgi:hypothetical protein